MAIGLRKCRGMNMWVVPTCKRRDLEGKDLSWESRVTMLMKSPTRLPIDQSAPGNALILLRIPEEYCNCMPLDTYLLLGTATAKTF